MITPDQFIEKWKAAELKERSAAQEHFIDLCRLLGEPTPAEADPRGEFYCFERGASKAAGGEGWADVWKRGHFGWEYKGRRKDLNAALGQLQQYALALENRRCWWSATSTASASTQVLLTPSARSMKSPWKTYETPLFGRS